MKHVEVYNFHKLLAGGVNGQAIFQQCAEIFARFLDKQLNILLTTSFGLILARTNFCAFAQTNQFARKN